MTIPAPIVVATFAELESALAGASSAERFYVSGGPLPDSCRQGACSVGIDEAGRGPVLGPMVYGAAVAPAGASDALRSLGVDDSKALTETKRETLFNALCSTIGWEVEVIPASYISACMYRRTKTSLNAVSHDAAIALIDWALSTGAQVDDIYVDTVGPAETYEDKLQKRFPGPKVTVRSKADSLYAVVGAASIMAKVVRDAAVRSRLGAVQLGSGYPGDPVTKAFLADGLDVVFGFDHVVRFSWSTAERLLDDRAVAVDWDNADEAPSATPAIRRFFNSTTTAQRHKYFTGRQLSVSSAF